MEMPEMLSKRWQTKSSKALPLAAGVFARSAAFKNRLTAAWKEDAIRVPPANPQVPHAREEVPQAFISQRFEELFDRQDEHTGMAQGLVPWLQVGLLVDQHPPRG